MIKHIVLMCAMLLPCMASAQDVTGEEFGGRSLLVYAPPSLGPAGSRALVVVLHGGMGNASRIALAQPESALNVNRLADQYGFVVAYLNGTPATLFLSANALAWNAGGDCCGQPAENNVDDVAYITGAVDALANKYGIDRARVYGLGHSNGAMMAQRMMCETHLFAAAVSVAGPLNVEAGSCPAAAGRHILGIHGAQDENVPIAGGHGAKGISRATYHSEAQTQEVYKQSGAFYTLDIVQGADHKLEHIDAALMQSEGMSIGQKAVQFFGLVH